MSLLKGLGQGLTDTASHSQRTLQAVVFDMDGVIIDSHPAHRMAWRRFLRELGKDVSESDLDFILDGRKRADILRYFLGDLSDAQLEEHGKYKDEFFKQVSLEVKTIPGVLQFLAMLEGRKIAVAVATSATESRARSTLAHLGLAERFQVVVTGTDVKEGKPDPAIYQLTCARLHMDGKCILAIEDAVSGVRAAKRAGLRCIGVSNTAATLIEAGAELVIPNFLGISIERLEALMQR
jgi:beta-phosphoglucomutase